MRAELVKSAYEHVYWWQCEYPDCKKPNLLHSTIAKYIKANDIIYCQSCGGKHRPAFIDQVSREPEQEKEKHGCPVCHDIKTEVLEFKYGMYICICKNCGNIYAVRR